MRCKILFQLYIELNQAVHGNCDGDSLETSHPDIGVPRILGALAVSVLSLGDDCDDCEERTNKAVLEYADPYNLNESVKKSPIVGHIYIEPCQTTVRFAQPAFILSSRTLLHPVQRPYPVFRLNIPEVFLLFVQVRRNVMAHECEKARNRESLVAVSQELKIYGVVVI